MPAANVTKTPGELFDTYDIEFPSDYADLLHVATAIYAARSVSFGAAAADLRTLHALRLAAVKEAADLIDAVDVAHDARVRYRKNRTE